MNQGAESLEPISFRCRSGLRRTDETYTLTATTLAGSDFTMALEDMVSIRLYSVPGMMSVFGAIARPQRFCVVRLRSGALIKLQAAYHQGVGEFAEQSQAFEKFSTSLARFALAANPRLRLELGMPPALWWSWFATFGLLTLMIAMVMIIGSIAMAEEHQFGWGTIGWMLVLAAIGTPPAMFLRGTWRRRPQPADRYSDDLWQRSERR